MKRILIFLLALCLILSATGCGVSQEDYDALQSEYDSVVAENNSLQEQVKSLSEQAESLSEYKKEQVAYELEQAYGKAWAATCFGDNTVCFTDGSSHLQCISEKTYEISNDGIAELWADFLNSVKILGVMSESETPVTYESISVKFLDSSGTYILDVILKKNGDSYILDAFMCNGIYSTIITSALNNLS